MRARCGGGAAACVPGVLAAPDTQGSLWLGQQEIQCSRRAWHSMEKEMATHSSILAWRIPGTWEPGGLLSIGSHRVGQD